MPSLAWSRIWLRVRHQMEAQSKISCSRSMCSVLCKARSTKSVFCSSSSPRMVSRMLTDASFKTQRFRLKEKTPLRAFRVWVMLSRLHPRKQRLLPLTSAPLAIFLLSFRDTSQHKTSLSPWPKENSAILHILLYLILVPALPVLLPQLRTELV
eukprot:29082_3